MVGTRTDVSGRKGQGFLLLPSKHNKAKRDARLAYKRTTPSATLALWPADRRPSYQMRVGEATDTW